MAEMKFLAFACRELLFGLSRSPLQTFGPCWGRDELMPSITVPRRSCSRRCTFRQIPFRRTACRRQRLSSAITSRPAGPGTTRCASASTSTRPIAGPLWTTHEEPLDLVARLAAIDGEGRAILVDCLTLWVTNLMMEERDIAAEFAALADCLPKAKARLVIVSNEVGLGIVPENRMARDFRDHAGRLHQMIAAEAAEVYFIAAGLPLKMKG